MATAINWFEIPTTDIDRAAKFYGTLLNLELNRTMAGDMPYAVFPYQAPGVGGALVLDPHSQPSMTGPLVYLNAVSTDNLNAIMGRVESAGGTTVLPVTNIGENGWIGIFADTEGNRIGLHTE